MHKHKDLREQATPDLTSIEDLEIEPLADELLDEVSGAGIVSCSISNCSAGVGDGCRSYPNSA